MTLSATGAIAADRIEPTREAQAQGKYVPVPVKTETGAPILLVNVAECLLDRLLIKRQITREHHDSGMALREIWQAAQHARKLVGGFEIRSSAGKPDPSWIAEANHRLYWRARQAAGNAVVSICCWDQMPPNGVPWEVVLVGFDRLVRDFGTPQPIGADE